MESDTKIEKRKMVEEFDGSSSVLASDEPLREEESQGFDVPRVLEKKETTCVSVDGGGGGGDDDDINMPLKELSAKKNIGNRKTGCNKEDSFDGSEVKEGLIDGEFGEKIDQNGSGILMGSDGLSQKPEFGVDVNGESSKVVGDYGNEGENLSTPGRRSRRSKIESGERSNSDVKIDPDKKASDILGSISQRTRNRVVKGKKEVVKVKDRNVEQNDSDEDSQEPGFCAGDFVWGKIKSHPWWPGRIYDPSNASDFAMRYKHEGRLLVAYFGDRTFAWCDPSQLKPYEENFEEMSMQSSLKNFVNAVEEAVDEFCCLVELQTSSASAKKGSQTALPLVVNAGIKEGVHVSLDGVEKFSDFHFEPIKMLAEIRNYARTISVTNMLELRVLISQLSASYHAKGGYSLPVYYEPLGIDDLGIEELVGKDIISREGSTRGSDEMNWCASPRDLSVAQTGPETPDGKLRRRRKEKSIAELLEVDTKVELTPNNIDGSKEEMQLGKVASKSGKKKRKFVRDDQSDGHDLTDVKARGIIKEEGQSGKLESESKSGQKRRKVVDKNQSPPVVESSRTTRSSARNKYESARKKSSSDKEDGRDEIDQEKKKSLAKNRKLSVSLGLENGVTAEEIQERISPREKKRSKYLSPPYTSPLPKQKSLGSVGGSLGFSDVARMGERMSIAAGQLVAGSPPMVKCSAEKSSKGLGSLPDKPYLPDNHTYRSLVKSIRSSDEVLCKMRFAALDPLKPRKDKSFDTIRGFLSSYRSANYKDGSDYNLNKKDMADRQKRERKRNSANAKKGLDKKADQDISEPETPGRSGMKKKGGKYELGNGSISSVALVITFPEEFTLPTKKDVMKMHSKFGVLDESKTEVLPKSSSAKIVFLNSLDAEAAMDSMQKRSPFGTAKVSYEIQHLTTASASKGKKRKLSLDKHTPGSPENEPLAVIFIKQKLEAMNSMLAQTDGKMSEETKSNLENDVKELLKKVKMMTASSSPPP